MDLFPTVVDLLGLPADSLVQPIDGISLKPVIEGMDGERPNPIPFRFGKQAALVDGRYKILTRDLSKGEFELYDLVIDRAENRDLSAKQVERFETMKRQLLEFHASVDASFAGKDYPEGRLDPPDPPSISWFEAKPYQPYLEQWQDRWEYQGYLKNSRKASRR
jgi:arylsulfatase A-like enzyme